ncbi:MAG TPA: toll/interleukin-1 receptor domain-containing protein [Anaerolineales bacterium]|nr:toll/interleukin-1 receptor domain-containing protein [Anaerolineales bacterium]
MTTEKPRRTFISYSRVDKEFAVALGTELRNSGINIWLDQFDIPTGVRWDDEIENALRECEIFLVVLTPTSSASENVKDEIGYAIDHGKQILPVLLKDCEIPLRLRRFQYVDFSKLNYHDGIERARQLLVSFGSQLPTYPQAGTPIPAPAPTQPPTPMEPNPPPPSGSNKKLWMWIAGAVAVLALGCCLLYVGYPVLFPPANPAPAMATPTLPFTAEATIPVAMPTAAATALGSITRPPAEDNSPRIFDFSACSDPCNGSNGITSFPSKVEIIHLAWQYANIPTGAHYVRNWSHEQKGSWVTYDCIWPGPSSGQVGLTLYDTGGLASGNWVITITVNDTVLLKERIFIEGSYGYWNPAGTFHSCYGS